MVMCWLVFGALLVCAEGLQVYDTGGSTGQQYQQKYQQDSVLLPGRPGRSGMFWTGSRYNRRGSDTSRGLDIKPRADRFFMGSRYGKRAVVQPPTEVKGVLEGGEALLCRINSYNSFYLCNRIDHDNA